MEAIITEEIHREKCLNDLLIKWMTQKSASAFYSQNYKMKLEENALYGWRRRHWKQLVVEREIQIGGDWLTNLPNARKSFNENWNRRSDPASPAIDPMPKESSFWFAEAQAEFRNNFVLWFLQKMLYFSQCSMKRIESHAEFSRFGMERLKNLYKWFWYLVDEDCILMYNCEPYRYRSSTSAER